MKTQQLEIKLSNKTEEDIKKARRKSTQAGEPSGVLATPARGPGGGLALLVRFPILWHGPSHLPPGSVPRVSSLPHIQGSQGKRQEAGKLSQALDLGPEIDRTSFSTHQELKSVCLP